MNTALQSFIVYQFYCQGKLSEIYVMFAQVASVFTILIFIFFPKFDD
jgi:hypothetical protein